ncbi:MAG TPA: alpha/beta hydrolase, partial [Candidatus Binatia bacterium]|nr:alpha/beta hydrolase [Candidatus Binatia bacterium]
MPIVPPEREHAVELADGRRLGVAAFGDAAGRPVFWFHGTPGARRQVPPAARRLARSENLRVVGVERPGVGQSTPHLYNSIAEFAADIEELADRLEIERFGLVGLSGGGPYVLGCAHAMPDRTVAGAVLGGVAPTRGVDAAAGGAMRLAVPLEPILNLVREPLGGLFTLLVQSLQPFADQAFDTYLRFAPAGDKRVLGDPEVREAFIEDMMLGSRENLRSFVYDVILFSRHWGFALSEISVPIHFWQGDEDNLVPPEHAEHLTRLVPGSRLIRDPSGGHLAG